MKKTTQAAMLFTIFLLALPLAAQEKSTREKKRSRDIRIMEGVLDKVLAGQSNRHFGTPSSTQGLYIKNYGMIFHAAKPVTHRYSAEITQAYEHQLKAVKERLSEVKHQQEATEKAARRVKPAKMAPERRKNIELFEMMSEHQIKNTEEALEEVKTQLTGFFTDYIPAISQLNQQDRVAVLVQMDPFGGANSRTLTSWIAVDRLNDLRTQRIDKAEFGTLIHFDQDNADAQGIQHDIDILLEILTRAMGPNRFYTKTGSKGLYLDGFGALLFLRLPGGVFINGKNDNVLIVAQDHLDRALTFSKGDAVGISAKTAGRDQAEEKQAEEVQALRDELFELVADYGHTLRLKPEENVLLSIETDSNILNWTRRDSRNRPLVYQLKKKDIDAYHSGRISLKELKHRQIQ